MFKLFSPTASPGARLRLSIGLLAAVFILSAGLGLAKSKPASSPPPARSPVSGSAKSMCDGQKPVSDKDIREAFDILAEILRLGAQRAPGDEENIIRGRGLNAQRLNCVFGKIMAGNDIFGWGPPAAYGISLSEEEMRAVRKYPQESEGLKAYLEEELNLKVEKD